GRHLKDIVDEILDLTRVDAGKATLHEESLDVAELLAETIAMMHPHAQGAGLGFAAAPADGAAALRADRRMVKQILINLLSNAVKFTPRGGRIEVSAGIGPSGGLSLCVRDTGIGMARENIPLALAPFGQIADV